MEEEISNLCYSMRYSAMTKFYHPFPETGEAKKATFKENSETACAGERKAMILTSCLSLLSFN